MEVFIVFAEIMFTLFGAYLLLYTEIRFIGDIVIPEMNGIRVENRSDKIKRLLFWSSVMVISIALSFTLSNCHDFEKPYNLIELWKSI